MPSPGSQTTRGVSQDRWAPMCPGSPVRYVVRSLARGRASVETARLRRPVDRCADGSVLQLRGTEGVATNRIIPKACQQIHAASADDHL